MTRPLDSGDLSALIRTLAVCEGLLMLGEPGSDQLARQLTQHLHAAGLLHEDATERDLRQALNDLNHRVRYAKGEYDRPPQP